MVSAKRVFFVTSLVCLVLLNSCTTTKFQSVWKDEGYKRHIESIMVVGVAERLDIRKFFEREFVKQFKECGVNAIASVDASTSEKELTEDVILAAAREQGTDMILVTHLLSIGATASYHLPKHATNFHTYYHWAYAYVHGPQYYTQSSQSVLLATNLYETETEKLIWSVTTKTIDVHESKFKIIKSKSKGVIKNLRKNKLLQ